MLPRWAERKRFYPPNLCTDTLPPFKVSYVFPTEAASPRGTTILDCDNRRNLLVSSPQQEPVGFAPYANEEHFTVLRASARGAFPPEGLLFVVFSNHVSISP